MGGYGDVGKGCVSALSDVVTRKSPELEAVFAKGGTCQSSTIPEPSHQEETPRPSIAKVCQ